MENTTVLPRLSTPAFRVGGWDVYPAAALLVRGSEVVRLEPKVMAVLCHLARQPGAVCTHEALLAAAWPQVVVGPKVLSRAISELRSAFGDTRSEAAYIETIPKRGYRLVAPVTTPPRATPAVGRRWLWGGAVLLLVLLLGWWTQPRPTAPAPMVRPLTSWEGLESAPALSPDGQQIVFSWEADTGGPARLYQMPLDATAPHPLTDPDGPEHETGAAWSPDGRTIAFFRHTATGRSLWTLAGDTLQKKFGAQANLASRVAWSPDGQWLVYADRPEPGAAFGLQAFAWPDGPRYRLTTPDADLLGDTQPAFSPQRLYLAFVRTHVEGVQSVHVHRVETQAGQLGLAGPVQVIETGRFVTGLFWHPDGEDLFYETDVGGLRTLWRMPVEDGVPQPVPRPATEALLMPSAQAGRLVFVQRRGALGLWHRGLHPGGVPRPGPASTRQDQQPSPSPDGHRLAFISDRSGPQALWLADTSGADARVLASFDGAYVSSPSWSSDGRFVVVAAAPEGQADLYRIAVETGEQIPLTTDPSHDLLPVWSPDGSWLYFASDRGGDWAIWRMPAAGGAAEQVSPPGGFAAQPTPDGQGLLFTQAGAAGLWHLDLATGTVRLQHPTLPLPYDWGNWAVAAEGLYLVDRTAAVPTLVFHAFAGPPVTPVFAFPRGLPGNQRSLALTPDGSALWYTQPDEQDADLMRVENFFD